VWDSQQNPKANGKLNIKLKKLCMQTSFRPLHSLGYIRPWALCLHTVRDTCTAKSSLPPPSLSSNLKPSLSTERFQMTSRRPYCSPSSKNTFFDYFKLPTVKEHQYGWNKNAPLCIAAILLILILFCSQQKNVKTL